MVGFEQVLSRNIQSNGRCGRKGTIMVKNIEDVQKMGKDNMEAAMNSFGAVSKSLQAIAVEMTDYSKKSFEQSGRRGRKARRRQVGRKGNRGAGRLRQARL